MLTGNTMRFGTDQFNSEFEQLPRLKFLINGITYAVRMTDFKMSSPCIVMRINKKKYYVWLVEPTNSIAHTRKNKNRRHNLRDSQHRLEDVILWNGWSKPHNFASFWGFAVLFSIT